jgi:hypothetical protein
LNFQGDKKYGIQKCGPKKLRPHRKKKERPATTRMSIGFQELSVEKLQTILIL